MAEHNDFGKWAEEKATEYFINKGYQILARNFRWKKAEIDIIARLSNLVIIIEVKARTTDLFMKPQEAVGHKKIKMIVEAADAFIHNNIDEKVEIRFDIITIIKNKNHIKINHIKSAFESIDAL